MAMLKTTIFSVLLTFLMVPMVLFAAESNLSKIDPMGSISSVTAPLDDLWKVVGIRFNLGLDSLKSIESLIDGSILSRPLKLAQEDSFKTKDTLLTLSNGISLGQAWGIAKSAFILVASILLTVMEIAALLLRGILELIR